MNKIYRHNNYIIVEEFGGPVYVFPIIHTIYFRDLKNDPNEYVIITSGASIEAQVRTTISVDDITGGQWENDLAVVYTDASFLAFIRLNTAVLPVAGGGGGGGLVTKAGVIAGGTFPVGPPRKFTVVFATPFTDANYAVSVIGGDGRIWKIEGKTPAQFVINSSSANAVIEPTDWIAIKSGEST